MKRLICATLALSLLGATAASAQTYRHGGGHHRSHGGGNGAAILGVGLGLFALAAIASSSQRDRYEDRYYDRYARATMGMATATSRNRRAMQKGSGKRRGPFC